MCFIQGDKYIYIYIVYNNITKNITKLTCKSKHHQQQTSVIYIYTFFFFSLTHCPFPLSVVRRTRRSRGVSKQACIHGHVVDFRHHHVEHLQRQPDRLPHRQQTEASLRHHRRDGEPGRLHVGNVRRVQLCEIFPSTYHRNLMWFLSESESEMFLFNDPLNTFYLRLYCVGHMANDHSDSEREEPRCHHMGYYFRLAERVIL